MTERPAHDETSPTVTASGDRSVGIGGDVTDSNIFTGDIKIESPITKARHQLRAPVGDFVGRELEIDTLINALRRESRACVTGISGMGGIGKTELALLVAERLRDDYPDAQFFINLQGTDANPRSPQDAMAICIRAFLGPEAKLPEEPEPLSHLYRSELSGKRVLLLLDNAADSAQVRPLLPPTGCAVLVTSRQSVALPGMTPLTLHSLTEEEARQLLLEIAARAEPAAEQICKLCGYLPLAVRAAGSLLAITADLDPADYALQLQDERSRLERIGTEGVEISVAASFNLSYEQLASEAARVFRLLSVFPATFDAAVEEVVCADAGHIQLSDLVRRSLVLYDKGTKRYRLHDLARLFADTKLSAEERAVGQKRFATPYRNMLIEHARAQLAIKRGQRPEQVDLDETISLTTEMSEELVMLDKALKKLAAVDERKALVVEYRFFGGFTIGEVADLLGTSSTTVEREWRFARLWLRREMTRRQVGRPPITVIYKQNYRRSLRRKRARSASLRAHKQTREAHFFTERERKPISLRFRTGVAINCRIASKTTLNCLSYLLSSSSNRRESSALDASICRSFTNARMISILTNTARSLFRTLDSIATPCSVKT